jgi:hypothetical protein
MIMNNNYSGKILEKINLVENRSIIEIVKLINDLDKNRNFEEKNIIVRYILSLYEKDLFCKIVREYNGKEISISGFSYYQYVVAILKDNTKIRFTFIPYLVDYKRKIRNKINLIFNEEETVDELIYPCTGLYNLTDILAKYSFIDNIKKVLKNNFK